MKPLNINHKIYGRFKITEPILIDLIKSPALQRLKEINQNGPFYLMKSPAKPQTKPFSRYEHSIGVMLLLRKFDASIEEQIHGLLHDISHTAFSHVADFVFGSKTSHTYQDSKTIKAYETQGVNKILIKYSFDPKYIVDEKNFTLAERDLPALCADRIDYTLQDPLGRNISKANPKSILKSLTTKDKQFVFKDKKGAEEFSFLSLALNKNLWCSPLEVALYEIMADILTIALNKKIITKKDLFTTDKLVMKKLILSGDKDILNKLKIIKNLEVKEVPKEKADIISRSKIRSVDPPVIQGNRLVKLTSICKAYKDQKNTWTNKAKKGFNIKILN